MLLIHRLLEKIVPSLFAGNFLLFYYSGWRVTSFIRIITITLIISIHKLYFIYLYKQQNISTTYY